MFYIIYLVSFWEIVLSETVLKAATNKEGVKQ